MDISHERVSMKEGGRLLMNPKRQRTVDLNAQTFTNAAAREANKET
jgi:hypothetical protein